MSMQQVNNLLKVVCSGPGERRTRVLSVTGPMLYHQTTSSMHMMILKELELFFFQLPKCINHKPYGFHLWEQTVTTRHNVLLFCLCNMHRFFIVFNSFFHAYQVPVRDTDELQKRLVTRAEFQHSLVDDAVDHWWKRLEACIRAEGGHFEHLL